MEIQSKLLDCSTHKTPYKVSHHLFLDVGHSYMVEQPPHYLLEHMMRQWRDIEATTICPVYLVSSVPPLEVVGRLRSSSGSSALIWVASSPDLYG